MGRKVEYNRNMMDGNPSWHRIAWSNRDLKTRDEHIASYNNMKSATEWCEGEMIRGRFTTYYYYGQSYFCFRDRNDLLAFKLMWGGN